MNNKVMISNFKHRRAIQDCKTLAIRDVFEFYSLKLSPYMCFGLGSGIYFELFDFSYGDKQIPSITIMGRNNNLEDNICELFRIKKITKSTDNSLEAWQGVKAIIDSGNPVIIEMDGAYLQGKVPEGNINKPRLGYPSSAVVVGYEEINEGTYVYLTNGVLSSYYKIELKDLMNARNATYIHFKERNKYSSFEFPSKLPDIDELIIKSIEKVKQNMIYTDKPKEGIKGMDEFIKRFRGILFLTQNVSEEKANKYLSILAKSIFVGFGPGSGSFFRKEYGKFLSEAGKMVNSKVLKEGGCEYLSISNEYRELRRQFNQLEGDRNSLMTTLEKIISKFEELMIWENKTLNGL